MKSFFLLLSLVLLTSCSDKKEAKVTSSPPSDKLIKLEKTEGQRKFRTYTLKNGLQVLLISDKSVNKSAAAMDVFVGSLANPEDQLGLAHYLEHMLFLGTEKYPTVGEYFKFIGKNQGNANAFTSRLNTNYLFEVNHNAFPEALDRFAQFFVSPLFDEKYLEKEKNAVDSEYRKNIQNDGWRTFRIWSILAMEGHPQSRFSTGSSESLKNVKRADVVRFYKDHYSADLMKLVVLSSSDLDTLENLVSERFSAVPKNDNKKFSAPTKYFSSKDLPRFVQVKPVSQTKQLTFLFEAPFSKPYWSSKPGELLGELFSYSGNGSLSSQLKDEGLALSVEAGSTDMMGLTGMFIIDVDLTEKGLTNTDRVAEVVFAYIKLLKENSANTKKFFEELKAIRDLKFKHRTPDQGISFVSDYASQMQYFPPLKVEERQSLLNHFSEEDLIQFLEPLTPKNLNLILTSPETKTNLTEEYYSIEYGVEPLHKGLVEKLENPSPLSAISLPEKNEFVPNENELNILSNSNFAEPGLALKNEKGRIFFSSDSTFLQPKTFVQLEIATPTPLDSPRSYLLAKLYEQAVVDSLSETFYPMTLAGYEISLKSTFSEDEMYITGPVGRLILSLNGFSSNIQKNLLRLVPQLKTLNLKSERFEDLKRKFAQELFNRRLEKAHVLAKVELNALSYSKYTHRQEYEELVESVTLDELVNFVETKLFEKVSLRLIVYGNENSDSWGDNTLSSIQNSLNAKNYEFDWKGRPVIKWEKGQSFAYKKQADLNNNNAWSSKIQFGTRTIEGEALLEFAQPIIQSDFFDSLRTDKQLGYIVYAGRTYYGPAYGIKMYIQSEKYSADRLALEADQWVKEKIVSIQNMELKSIETLRSPILQALSEKPTSMDDQFENLVSAVEIYNGDFKHKEKLIEAVQNYPAQQVIDDLAKGMSLQGGGQMSVYYSAAGKPEPTLLPQEKEILDQKAFRESAETYEDVD